MTEKPLPLHVILKRERLRRGLSQQNVAAELQCDLRTVGRWERGETAPGPYNIQRLMKLFQKDAVELGLVSAEVPELVDASLPESPSPAQVPASVPATTPDASTQEAPPVPHLFVEEQVYIIPAEHFYGHSIELAQVEQWITNEHCQVIAVLGLGGTGKTTFVRKIVQSMRSSFAHVIWQSLQNVPSLENFIASCLHFIPQAGRVEQLHTIDERISLLGELLRTQRCLLILDNVDSLLQEGQRAGHYLAGYEGYGKLLAHLGETAHQSCLLLTSREKPKEIVHMEGIGTRVRSLLLPGMLPVDGKQLLQERGLAGLDEDWVTLVRRYSGNPLALKLVSTSIRELFGGDIAAFLHEEETVFGEIYDLLAQQFQRLSALEQDIMFWLAIEREALSLKNLREDIADQASKGPLLDALTSLRERTMIEVSDNHCFTLQPVIMEYVTKYFVELITTWISEEDIIPLGRYTLIKAQTSDYVRESQVRFILAPSAEKLVAAMGKTACIEKLRALLVKLRAAAPQATDYAAGNILNLLVHLQPDLHGIDCSDLTIHHAYLTEVELAGANFSRALLKHCAFKSTFTWLLCLAVDSSGTFLAGGTTTGEVRVWRVADAAPVLTCTGHTDEIRAVAFSPNGRSLVSGSDDHTVRIWDMSTGACRVTLSDHTDMLRTVAFSADGRLIASGGEDRTIHLWDCESWHLLYKLQGHTARVRTLAFHPEKLLLASAGDDLVVRLWDGTTGLPLTTLVGHTKYVRTIAFSPDGTLLASGGEDRTIHLWDTTNWERRSILSGHTDRVRTLTFSADSLQVVSGSDDCTLRFWDVSLGQVASVIPGHTNRIWSVACVPGSTLLISTSEDDTLRWWDLRTGYCLRTLLGYTDLIKSVAFHPHAPLVVSASEDKSLRIWNTQSGLCLKVLLGHANRVRAVTFSPDGTLVASCSEDETIRIWNVQSGRSLKILHGHTHLVRSVAFDPTGQWLVSGSHDLTVRIWNVRTWQTHQVLQAGQGLVWGIAFHPAGHLIASGGDDPLVKLWNSQTGQLVRTLQGHTHRVWSLAFSRDGNLLATASDDLTLRVWDVATGCYLRTLEGHDEWVHAVAFSPDGTLLASGSHDLTVRLWEVESGRCIRVLYGHEGWVWSVAFSADGQTVVSGGDDGAIKLWSVETGICTRTLRRGRPYEEMNIADVRGISEAQKDALYFLGAIEEFSPSAD